MSDFEHANVDELIARCRTGGLSPFARGEALEELVSVTFAVIPGVGVCARNAKSVFENEEFDLVMSNLGIREGLHTVGSLFSVECKNWSRPVGSMEVCWFATKLRRSQQDFGVLVCASGITGDAARLTAARFEAAAALTEGQRVVALTLDELAWLRSGEQLAELLIEKQARLVMRREIYVSELRTAPASPRLTPQWAEPPIERDTLIRELAAQTSEGHGFESLESAVEAFRSALTTFLENEGSEPSLGGDGKDSEFDIWNELNQASFEAVEASLRTLAMNCIARLRARPGDGWAGEQMILGVQIRPPARLATAPDDDLSELLLGHWLARASTGPQYVADDALICVLGMCAEWLAAIQSERWPPPWI